MLLHHIKKLLDLIRLGLSSAWLDDASIARRGMRIHLMAATRAAVAVTERLHQPAELGKAQRPPLQRLLVKFTYLGNAFSSNRSRAILSRHTSGASVWTFLPSASTATVTGKSLTSNS